MFLKKEFTHSYTIKAGPESYCRFSLVIIPVILVWMLFYIRNPHPNVWQPLLIFWVLISSSLIWLNSFKITLTEDGFRYQSFFCLGRRFFYKDLRSLALTLGFQIGDPSRRTVFSRLKIYEFMNPNPAKLNINHFSQNDLTLLIQLALEKTPDIELNAAALYFARGEYDMLKNFGVRGLLLCSLWLLWGILLRTLIVNV